MLGPVSSQIWPSSAPSSATDRNRWRRRRLVLRWPAPARRPGGARPRSRKTRLSSIAGPAIAALHRQLGERRPPHRARQAPRRPRCSASSAATDIGDQARRTPPARSPARGRRRWRSSASSSRQLGRGEAHRVGQRLAVDEGARSAARPSACRRGRPCTSTK